MYCVGDWEKRDACVLVANENFESFFLLKFVQRKQLYWISFNIECENQENS